MSNDDDRPDPIPGAAEAAPDIAAPPGTAKPVLDYGSPAEPGGRWVHLWTAQNSFEAELAVMRLQDHGLYARADMLHTAGLGAWGGAGPGTVNIEVPQGDFEAARRVITEIEQERARRRHARSLVCPRCAAAPAKRAVHPLRWAALAALVAVPVLIAVAEQLPFGTGWPAAMLILAGLVLLVWPVTPRWRCRACGEHWSQPEPDERADEDEPETPPTRDAGSDEDNDDDEDEDEEAA
jgi:hypothetical protein